MTIHYHGTPITPTSEIRAMQGAHFCVSHWRPDQDALCHQIGQSVLLDNGAFNAWTAGAVIEDWRPFYEWADRWLDYPADIAIIPDVITGSAEENDALLLQWPHGDRGMPVWHMHEPIERLLGLIERYPRVAFGSSGAYRIVLSPPWEMRMDDAWRAITRVFGRTPDTHMLRGGQCCGKRWPFARVDSTNLARNHNRKQNTAAKMQHRLDAVQCPARFVDPGQQMELVA